MQANSIDLITSPAGPGKHPEKAQFSLANMVLGLTTIFIGIGVIMVFTATARLDQPIWPDQPFKSVAVRQITFSAFGLVMMWGTYFLGHRRLDWRGPSAPYRAKITRKTGIQPAIIIMILIMICLVVVLIPGIGIERNGARRWLPLGPAHVGLGFQPSEIAKLGLVILLAAWLAHRRNTMPFFWKGMIPPALLIGVSAGLVVPEDLGTASLMVIVGGAMVVCAGAKIRHALLMALPALGGFAAMIWVEPYRLQRIISFTDIWADPLGKGYHAIQSLVAIASGGWYGQGLGAGLQKYGYLPESQNDFIFSILCEEMGVLGGLAVIGLFLWLTILGWVAARRCTNLYSQLLAFGVTFMIGIQAAMNIAVVTVSVPTKGISLPFISAGGSGVLVYCVAMGLLASVARESSNRPGASPS